MQKHPMIEQLIDAQLDFLDQVFSQSETIQSEFYEFYLWLRKQTLKDLWSCELINQLLQKQILDTAASSFLIEQIAEHIRFALVHPANDKPKLQMSFRY